jgi:peptide deformylase
MAILNILEYPDERLRVRAKPVETVDDTIRRLIDDMLETMYVAPGVGLAAPQVNVARQLIVMDISEEKNAPLVFINPEILARDGEEESEEGCLSLPGIFEKVRRAATVTVRALDRDGKLFEMESDKLLAVCIQHEMDHLDGKLFVDHLSSLKRQRARKKLEKARREQATARKSERGAHHTAI